MVSFILSIVRWGAQGLRVLPGLLLALVQVVIHWRRLRALLRQKRGAP